MYGIHSQIQPFNMNPETLSAHIGEEVSLHGMVYKIREMSGFAFVVLQTGAALLQCVYSEDFSRFPLSLLQENMAVKVCGTVVAEPRSKSGCEVRLTCAEVLSRPQEQPPVVICNKSVNTSLETLLDYRPITLRNVRERAVFKIQAEICRGMRHFLDQHGFTEIHTPKIVSGSAEGGANVFRLDYFGREAFLAQSPQFYKQAMVGVFERVYEIAPVFRAEKHDTSRHINEYTSVDVEMGFIESYTELMQTEAALLTYTFAHLREHCADELALWNVQLPATENIPALTFADAKALIAETYHREITDEEDFEPEEEKLLCEIIRRQTGSELVFVTEYKSSKRPFYAKDCAADPRVTDSFDLLFRGLEVTTGGERICDYGEQVQKMRARGMDIEGFSSYLMAHRYGLPPHGGFGIGLERLTAKLLGFENVRHATMFPRDIHRLCP